MDLKEPKLVDLLYKHTSLDIAYAVFGANLYSGLQSNGDGNDTSLLFDKVDIIKRPEGYYTCSDIFIPADAIDKEQDLYATIKEHRNKRPLTSFSYQHALSEGVQHEFDVRLGSIM